MNNQVRLRILLIISSIAVWLLSNLYFFFIKLGGSVFLWTGLVELIFFSIGVIALALIIRGMVLNPHWRTNKNYLALGISFALLLLLKIPVLHADENTLQSKVKIKACYEGAMYTSKVFLREDYSFEEFNLGFMGYVNYAGGTWEEKKDTLQLNFKYPVPEFLGKKMMIKNDVLNKVQGDTLVPTPYYLGDCKGKK